MNIISGISSGLASFGTLLYDGVTSLGGMFSGGSKAPELKQTQESSASDNQKPKPLSSFAKNEGVSSISHKKREQSIFQNKKNATNNSSLKLLFPEIYSRTGVISNYHLALQLLMLQADKKKRKMDELLEEMLEKSNEIAKLSEAINKESLATSELRKEASDLEYEASMGEARSGTAATVVGGIAGVATGIGAALVTGGLAAAIPAAAQAYNLTSNATQQIASCSGIALKIIAAGKTKEAEAKQAGVHLLKDKQSRLNHEISVLQSNYSAAAQSYNLCMNVMQSVIAAAYDAKKTIISNIRL